MLAKNITIMCPEGILKNLTKNNIIINNYVVATFCNKS